MTRLALAAAGILLGLSARRCTDHFPDLRRHADTSEPAT